ncbi:MAG: DUF58 domain-containing protein, partial [Gammaproteobacteria bacterium]|nr:DUF58 domain-containing protein [Gammaproteobacteria bacterium]
QVFEEAVSLAASFVCTIETQENLLDLMFIGDQAYTYSAGVGQLHTDGMLEILAGVRACGDRPFSDLHQAVVARRSSLSGCILILLVWDDARRRMVDELNALGLPLLVFVITDATETVEDSNSRLHILKVGAVEEGLVGL